MYLYIYQPLQWLYMPDDLDPHLGKIYIYIRIDIYLSRTIYTYIYIKPLNCSGCQTASAQKAFVFHSVAASRAQKSHQLVEAFGCFNCHAMSPRTSRICLCTVWGKLFHGMVHSFQNQHPRRPFAKGVNQFLHRKMGVPACCPDL